VRLVGETPLEQLVVPLLAVVRARSAIVPRGAFVVDVRERLKEQCAGHGVSRGLVVLRRLAFATLGTSRTVALVANPILDACSGTHLLIQRRPKAALPLLPFFGDGEEAGDRTKVGLREHSVRGRLLHGGFEFRGARRPQQIVRSPVLSRALVAPRAPSKDRRRILVGSVITPCLVSNQKVSKYTRYMYSEESKLLAYIVSK
jgi:hypothetical protein